MKTGRYLPILDEGALIANPTLAVWTLMNYAGNELDAKAATILISGEDFEIRQGNQTGYSRPAELVIKDIAKGTKLGQLVGHIAIQAYQNFDKRGSLDVGKAVFLVSEFAATNTTNDGKPLPSDASRLRKEFNRYRDVCHLWAAFVVLDETTKEKMVSSPEPVDEFFPLARAFQELLERAGLFNGRHPWKIPEEVMRLYDGRYLELDIGTETEFIRKKLKEYRPGKIR